jgi:hypothetical protein
MPIVVRVPPVLDDGTPFPTRYWLTCPLAVRRVSRIEGEGGVKAAEARLDADPKRAARYQEAALRYAAERDAAVPPEAGHRPSGGIGGTRRGVKCLHAQYADHAAGNDNPVGEDVAALVEPLDCHVTCVGGEGGAVLPNPMWREPR